MSRPANFNIKRIIVSRTDAIGDVILTLPVCGLLKKHFPDSKIIFLGRTYTQPVINCSEYVDEFMNADDLLKLNDKDATEALKKIKADVFIHVFPNKRIAQLAKKAAIKYRIGTTNRLFHWRTVNKLVHLSRKNSVLHEAQLNCKLLSPLGIDFIPTLPELALFTGFTNIPDTKAGLSLLDSNKINVVLHPKSNASAREWDLKNYRTLIDLLPPEKYKIFISGTGKEKIILSDWIKTLPANIVDITGRFSLSEFIGFIRKADYLVAASTGPLHIAAATGIGAIGLYPPIKPMHPLRWGPVGKKAKYLCVRKECNDCKNKPQSCVCMNEIVPVEVAKLITG